MGAAFSSRSRTGVLLAFAAVAFWSANFLFARLLVGEVPPFTLILLRCLVALAVFTPIALREFVRDWSLLRARPVLHVFLALAGFGLFNALIYLAGKTSSVITMSLLATSAPMFMVVLARFFLDEPLTVRRIIGILTAAAGAAILITKGNLRQIADLSFQPGDFLMLAAAFLFACYSVGLRRKSPAIGGNAFILATFIASTVFLLPFSAWELFVAHLPLQPTPRAITGVIYLGVVASVICYWCWNNAITRIGPTNAGLIYYTSPLFGGILAITFAGEPVLWSHVAGGTLIIIGVFTATR